MNERASRGVLDSIRAARAREDTALAAYMAAAGRRESAARRRSEVLAREDAKLAAADAALEAAIAAVAGAVGSSDRAAEVLGISLGVVRNAVSAQRGTTPPGTSRTRPQTQARSTVQTGPDDESVAAESPRVARSPEVP